MSGTINPPSIWCCARLPIGGGLFYTCTLKKGHSGPHRAHGDRNQLLKTWLQKPHPATLPENLAPALISAMSGATA